MPLRQQRRTHDPHPLLVPDVPGLRHGNRAYAGCVYFDGVGMTDLRTAAQQALEALEEVNKSPWLEDCYHAFDDEVTALRAALVEDAMQKFTDVNQELQAALGCDHCNSPLYAAVKCRVCGRVTEPVQKPVAWYFEARHIDSAWAAAVTMKHPGPEGKYMRKVTPLYTALPPRKPLTEEEIRDLWSWAMTAEAERTATTQQHAFARAIERAHGIV